MGGFAIYFLMSKLFTFALQEVEVIHQCFSGLETPSSSKILSKLKFPSVTFSPGKWIQSILCFLDLYTIVIFTCDNDF